jgi:hypothetical protein
MKQCNRRSFLGLLLAVSSGGIVAAGCARRADKQTTFAAWSDWLLAGGNRDAVVRVGRLYLETRPGDLHIGTLLAEVDHAIAGRLKNAHPASASAQAVGAALDRAVRGEYAGGEVVNVGGWVLSISEARVYAAIALLAGIGGKSAWGPAIRRDLDLGQTIEGRSAV